MTAERRRAYFFTFFSLLDWLEASVCLVLCFFWVGWVCLGVCLLVASFLKFPRSFA